MEFTIFLFWLDSAVDNLGHGLWAFAKDPIDVSSEFADALYACMEFVVTHTPQETCLTLIPELQDLIEDWDELSYEARGERSGFIIGKYGVQILATKGVSKMVTAYRDLKRANNMLAFETMAISKRNRDLIKIQALKKAKMRKSLIEEGKLKIMRLFRK